jgi:hypothetical protein
MGNEQHPQRRDPNFLVELTQAMRTGELPGHALLENIEEARARLRQTSLGTLDRLYALGFQDAQEINYRLEILDNKSDEHLPLSVDLDVVAGSFEKERASAKKMEDQLRYKQLAACSRAAYGIALMAAARSLDNTDILTQESGKLVSATWDLVRSAKEDMPQEHFEIYLQVFDEVFHPPDESIQADLN